MYEKISSVEVLTHSNIMEKDQDEVENFKEHPPQLKIEEARLMEEENNSCLDTPKRIEEVPNDEVSLFVKRKSSLKRLSMER